MATDCKVDFNILWLIVSGPMALLTGSILIISITSCSSIVTLFNLSLHRWYNCGSWFKVSSTFETDEKYLFNTSTFSVSVKAILNSPVSDVYCIGGMSFVGFA